MSEAIAAGMAGKKNSLATEDTENTEKNLKCF
jgi:hypothetical protein